MIFGIFNFNSPLSVILIPMIFTNENREKEELNRTSSSKMQTTATKKWYFCAASITFFRATIDGSTMRLSHRAIQHTCTIVDEYFRMVYHHQYRSENDVWIMWKNGRKKRVKIADTAENHCDCIDDFRFIGFSTIWISSNSMFALELEHAECIKIGWCSWAPITSRVSFFMFSIRIHSIRNERAGYFGVRWNYANRRHIFPTRAQWRLQLGVVETKANKKFHYLN